MVGWLHMDVLKQKGTHFINYKKKNVSSLVGNIGNGRGSACMDI